MPNQAERADLPPRPFFYTIDQIADMLVASQEYVRQALVIHDGRQIAIDQAKMRAVNIAPPNLPAEWRILDDEFIRWLRHKKIRVYDSKIQL